MQKEYITDKAWIKILKFFEKHPRVYNRLYYLCWYEF